MSKLTSTFATMIRQATRSFRTFCEMCNQETLWHFVAEDARTEIYKCGKCNQRKGWTVR